MMINFTVVGFGFMGMIHAGNILKNPNSRLSSIVDKNHGDITKKLEAQSGNFAAEGIHVENLADVKFFHNLEECLQLQKPDACIISVHTHLHYELAKMALNAGAHVFIEKPFCLDIKQGEELTELAVKNKKILMIGHVVRFMPAYLTLKNWIHGQELGKIEFLSMSRFSGLPSWGQWLDRQKEFGSSGGALFDLVIHDIDFAHWVCGSPSHIESSILPGKLSEYDYISAMWYYEHKAFHVKIEGGNTFHPAYPFHASFSARFENASVVFSSNDPAHIVIATNSGTKLVPVGDANEGFAGEINYFADCILKNEQPILCHPESAIETIKMCYRHIIT